MEEKRFLSLLDLWRNCGVALLIISLWGHEQGTLEAVTSQGIYTSLGLRQVICRFYFTSKNLDIPIAPRFRNAQHETKSRSG